MQGITFRADRLPRAVSFHVDEAVIKSSAQGTGFLVLDVRENLLGDGGRNCHVCAVEEYTEIQKE